MKTLSYSAARHMLMACADEIIKSKPYLTEIDSKIGDGDHGIGMAGGMQKALSKLETMADGENVYDLFQAMGKTMLMSMGGASGVIFGTFFSGGAKGKEPSAALDARAFAQLMADSLAEVQRRGKAEVGDKTMVDALKPAVDAMSAYAGEDLGEMLSLAEEAAKEGVEQTKQYVAKFGRAKSLMERAIGYQDAGATSIWIILRAMRDDLKAQEEEGIAQ